MPTLVNKSRQDPIIASDIVEQLAKSEAGAWQLAKVYAFVYPNIKSFQRSSHAGAIIQKMKVSLDAAVAAGILPSTWVGEVRGWESEEAAIRYFSLLIELLKAPIVLKITTPPMYNLSQASLFLKKAVVLINSQSLIKGGSKHKRSKAFDRVLSGVYVITGYKHTISKSKAVSQFVMYRDPFDFIHFLQDDTDSYASDIDMHIEADSFRIDNFA